MRARVKLCSWWSFSFVAAVYHLLCPVLQAGCYDISLGSSPIDYSYEEIVSQRKAGSELTSALETALQMGDDSFTIPAGVYRLPHTWVIQDVTNFHIAAENVELISENNTNHINFFGCSQTSITGPLILDASPFGWTQATVQGTDNSSYILLQLMPGYPLPDRPQRLMFFDPGGNLLPLYQVTADSYELVSEGLYKAYMPSYFFTQWYSETSACLQTGNSVAIELLGRGSGIFIKGNSGIYLSNINMYSTGLLFGQDEAGPVVVDKWMSVRRPGTNRLVTGGAMAISFKGGSFSMNNSELCCHFDDLTDLQAGIWYAYNQTAPRKVYLANLGDLEPGTTFDFYNLSSLKYDGTARLMSLVPVNDTKFIKGFQDKLNNLGLLTQNASLYLATLDSDVKLTSQIELVDIQQYRPSQMVFENSYFHEGLASGINAKGAKDIIIKNNTVWRSGYRGAAAGFDPYWWEGGVPSNITIEGNTIESTPYGVAYSEGSINTYVDTSFQLLASANFSVIRNVTVRNNTIISPPVAGIELSYVHDAVIEGNIIVDPVSRLSYNPYNISTPFQDASAIFLDVISGSMEISENLIYSTNLASIPQVIRAANGTNESSLDICSNQISYDGVSKYLPSELWQNILIDASAKQLNASGVSIQKQGKATLFQFTTWGGRQQNTFNAVNSSLNSIVSFIAKSTGIQVFGCKGPMYGRVDILLNGTNITSVDLSILGFEGLNLDPEIGFCQQTIYAVSGLSLGQHNLTLVSRSRTLRGKSVNGLAISSFSWLQGYDQCKQGIASQNASSPLLAPSPAFSQNLVPYNSPPIERTLPVQALQELIFQSFG